MSTEITPWWRCMALRPEIAKSGGNINDVQMSVFHVAHQPEDVPYGNVDYYSEITHPTRGLLELMGSVAVRLAAPSNAGTVKAVWRGDQGMGGGKSHAEVGLFHMANDPEAFFKTILGKRVRQRAADISGETIEPDLGEPTVVVLPCDEMDPFKPNKERDNIADTLGERWLWRLVGADLTMFNRYKDTIGTPDGIKAAMEAVGGRVLTLVDEVLNYIRKATADASKTDRAQQDMAFLRDLMDATNRSQHAAMVIVMIASDIDRVAMGEFGETIRDEMETVVTKFGTTIATTSGGDFAEIIRKRLFDAAPPAEVVEKTAEAYFWNVIEGWKGVFGQFGWWTDGFASNVARSYPFHPALIDLVEREWANRAGFQRVRSTIQIFAAAVHEWTERAKDDQWAPTLIGLGDLPLSASLVRESLLKSGVITDSRTVANYREIAANDVVDGDDQRGAARRIDVERGEVLVAQINPRAAERAATCMYLGSLAPRAQGAVGATDAELRVAAFVPDRLCSLADIDAVVTTLESPDRGVATLDIKPGKGGQPRRLLMSTTQTLQMFFRSQRGTVVAEPEVIAKVLRDEAQAEMSKGPFGKQRFVSAEGYLDANDKDEDRTTGLIAAIKAAGIDEAENRLIVLDPFAFTLLNGVDSETRIALSAALGLHKPAGWEGWWPTPMDVAYASSCIFAVVNTQRRKPAVAAATDYLAWHRVCEISNVAADDDLREQAEAERREKKHSLRSNLRKAYQHLVHLGETREAVSVRLDKDNQTALDGTQVWKVLAEREKTFDEGEFDAHALLFQLRNSDYGRSLDSIRTDFYRSPRLPLLYDGDTDLRNALYTAAKSGGVVIKNSSGQVADPARPGDINVNSKGLVLERPTPPEEKSPEGDGYDSEPPSDCEIGDPAPKVDTSEYGTGGGVGSGSGDDTDSTGTPPAEEERVSVTLMGSTFASEEQDVGYRFFSTLAAAVDSGEISYGQVQIQVVVPRAVADQIQENAERLGATVSRTEV